MSTTLSKPITELYTPVLNALDHVKASLLAIVPPESQLLAQTLQHSLQSGGKYLRPAVTLLAGAATNSHKTINASLVEAAAVAEMIHIATLLHDDVLDDSSLRRGKKTVRAEWGNRVSVLSGDYLLAQASLKLAEVGNIRLVAIFSQVLADLCDGEVEQIRSSYDLETPWESYYRKTICKTASLFSAGCESAGVLNGLPEEQIQALRDYGKNFGIAFQIVDDLLDYTSSEAEMGKPVMDDLRHGLLNAPVLLALESEVLTQEERIALKALIEQLFEASETDAQAIIPQLFDVLHQTRAIENTQALAHQYVEASLAALQFVPAGLEKDSLVGLVQSVIHRRQ